MKRIKNYICLVDTHRRASRMRNTAGRYRVGARTEDEAKKLLQKAVGFGSIQVYYVDQNPKTSSLAKQGECFKEVGYHQGTVKLVPVRHANSKFERQ